MSEAQAGSRAKEAQVVRLEALLSARDAMVQTPNHENETSNNLFLMGEVPL